VLGREHPGEPALVYFELAPREDVDVDGLVKNVVELAQAGFKSDVEWLREQTGYELSDAPEEKEDIRVNDAVKGDEEADEEVDRDIRKRLARLAEADDDELEREFALFNRDFPKLGRILNGGADEPRDADGKWTAAPARISAEEADTLLTQGFSEKDADGREIKFGSRMKEHFEKDHTPEEARRRKENLPMARETVRSGQRVEVADPKTGAIRANYAKYFSDPKGKEQGFLSVVDATDNEAFTAYRAPRRYIEKKTGIKNRRSDDQGEQPPLAVLQAMAAAGNLPDWVKLS
jgi:hypothetical protein